MDIQFLVICGAIFIIAGVVKGISGMGLPTVSMALLGLIMPPAEAAMLMLLPSLLTNLAQCTGQYLRSLCLRLWPMWTGLILLAIFSPLADIGGSDKHVRLLLGMLLVAYGLWGIVKPVLPEFGRYVHLAGFFAGVLSGILTAATGVFVIPLVPYLQSQKLAKDELIQALGLSFMLATIALSIRLGSVESAGLKPDLVAQLIALVSACVGLWFGSAVRSHMRPTQFQRALYIILLFLGIVMVVRSL
jgi:uncharacterized membrane protein YfcA